MPEAHSTSIEPSAGDDHAADDQAADDRAANSEAANSEAANSQATDDQVANSRAADDQAANNQAADSQAPDGQVTNGEVAADAAESGSSWFEPAVPHADPATTEWFLRTGRAGLRPDSVTETWDEERHAAERPVTAANPPWAGERADVTSDSPPPWESGPWPGPGEDGLAPGQAHEEGQAAPEEAVAQDADAAPAGNWQATAALGTGILPLVVPGLVFGVLGLRRAAVTGIGRAWSMIGIALSVIWAVVLSVYLASGGQSAQACGASQNGVTYAVSQVLHDLGTGAPQGVLTQDLRTAINQANSAAAAATSQLGVRDALVALTSGLQQTQQDASASPQRVSNATLRAEVAAGMAAVTAACKA
jgi:hypothetical protein